MKELSYTSVDRILSKLQRDLGMDDISEIDVIEWTGEALEAIGGVTVTEEIVCFSEVRNYHTEMPPFVSSIIQIAVNNEWEDTSDNTSCSAGEIVKAVACEPNDAEETCVEDCVTPAKYIPVDGYGYPINESDLYEYRPNINILMEYIDWVGSEYYLQKWTPVRLANHSFFNSIVCQEDESMSGLYETCHDEYTIIGSNKKLRFSFKNGFVAIAYNKQVLDENGYPMIPDHYSYVTAVTKYITMKLMERAWYSGREGFGDKVKKAEADWQWYCGQASSKGKMPSVDMLQNMLEQRNYLLPRIYRYNQFFSGMSRRELRAYNDPDLRNNY